MLYHHFNRFCNRSICILSSPTLEPFIHNSAIESFLPSISTYQTAEEELSIGIRKFDHHEVTINKTEVLGVGMFGKCFKGQLGPLEVCLNVIRRAKLYKSSFYTEANALSKLCYSSISFMHGVCLYKSYPIVVLNLIHGQTLHSVIHHESYNLCNMQWKQVVTSSMEALKYIHGKRFCHNDIKENNLMVEVTNQQTKTILIDFGKCCHFGQGKFYRLSGITNDYTW